MSGQPAKQPKPRGSGDSVQTSRWSREELQRSNERLQRDLDHVRERLAERERQIVDAERQIADAAKKIADLERQLAILLVPTNLKVGKEALDGFVESDTMSSEFIVLEVILEIRRSKSAPVDHGSFYPATVRFSRVVAGPTSFVWTTPIAVARPRHLPAHTPANRSFAAFFSRYSSRSSVILSGGYVFVHLSQPRIGPGAISTRHSG